VAAPEAHGSRVQTLASEKPEDQRQLAAVMDLVLDDVPQHVDWSDYLSPWGLDFSREVIVT
jgi:hypothetical protein